MKINRNSWHYKLLTAFEVCLYTNISLCKYFWLVVGVLAFATLLGFLALWVSLSCVYALMWILNIETVLEFCVRYGVDAPLAGMFRDCLMVVITMAILLTRKIIKRKEPRERKPSIIMEYLKAKKRKVCPLIKFTD